LAGCAGRGVDCHHCTGCFIRAVYFGDAEKVVGADFLLKTEMSLDKDTPKIKRADQPLLIHPV